MWHSIYPLANLCVWHVTIVVLKKLLIFGPFGPFFHSLRFTWDWIVIKLTRAIFASFIHQLWFACPWITLNENPTVWLNGASSANTFILPSFGWIMPTHHMAYSPNGVQVKGISRASSNKPNRGSLFRLIRGKWEWCYVVTSPSMACIINVLRS
jgi:hypothetical protein